MASFVVTRLDTGPEEFADVLPLRAGDPGDARLGSFRLCALLSGAADPVPSDSQVEVLLPGEDPR